MQCVSDNVNILLPRTLCKELLWTRWDTQWQPPDVSIGILDTEVELR